MRKDWKYLAYVLTAVLVYVIVKLVGPKQYDWSVTYSHVDKNPYGTYALHGLLPGLFDNKKTLHSYKTLYELKDSIQPGDNIFIISSTFSCGKEDADVLLDHVSKGASAFVSAQYFWGHFADTLGFTTYDNFFTKGDQALQGKDSTYLKFANPRLDTTERYWFKRDNVHNYFVMFDTTRVSVIADNGFGQPVTLRYTWGKGQIILNTTPMAFTNIYLLASTNHKYIADMLSYLDAKKNVHRTEYYHMGRMESASPLRFILTNEPLAWAYYILIAMVLLFMVFEAKRKQRVIPVIRPLGNTSLEFVSTIGNLYYHKGDHKNMAEKKITFLLDQIRTRYLLRTTEFNEDFLTALTRKSGNNIEDVRALFRSVSYIQSSTIISAGQLMDLNDKIERFFHQ